MPTYFPDRLLGQCLTARSLHRIVRDLGVAAGLKDVWPHGLRYATITTALDRTGRDIRAVQRFSRHRDVRVLAVYDDNREDLGGRVARLVATPLRASDQHRPGVTEATTGRNLAALLRNR